MDNDQQRDTAEEAYWSDHCPACDYSPCIGKAGKGSCLEADQTSLMTAKRCAVCGGLNPGDSSHARCM